MTDIVHSDIIKFISHELDVDYSSVNMDTSLNYDLGIDGDDAIEFFEKIQEEFHVNLSTFIIEDYDKYFGPEGFNPLELVMILLKRSKKPERFTIQMLIAACKKSG